MIVRAPACAVWLKLPRESLACDPTQRCVGWGILCLNARRLMHAQADSAMQPSINQTTAHSLALRRDAHAMLTLPHRPTERLADKSITQHTLARTGVLRPVRVGLGLRALRSGAARRHRLAHRGGQSVGQSVSQSMGPPSALLAHSNRSIGRPPHLNSSHLITWTTTTIRQSSLYNNRCRRPSTTCSASGAR